MKVITKKDAIIEAWHIADYLKSSPDHPANEIAHSRFSEEWEGKWKSSDFTVWSDTFDVSASRMKHTDGRIRNSYSDAENLINFALFCVTYFPARPKVEEWAKNLLDENKVRATLTRPERSYYFHGATVEEVAERILEAQALARICQQAAA